jgi:hypothetical protein
MTAGGSVPLASSITVSPSVIIRTKQGLNMQENWGQKLLFQVLDSSSFIRIAIGTTAFNIGEVQAAIDGTIGDSSVTYLKNCTQISNTTGDTVKRSGILINKGDFIELSMQTNKDSVIVFYRNLTNNNSAQLVRYTSPQTVTKIALTNGLPIIYPARCHVRLIDFSITNQEDFDICFLGNSITEGYGATDWDSTWVARLKREAGIYCKKLCIWQPNGYGLYKS